MAAQILPDKEDIERVPAMAGRIEEAKRNLLPPADVTSAVAEFNVGNQAGAQDAMSNSRAVPTRAATVLEDDGAQTPPTAKKTAAPQKPQQSKQPEQSAPQIGRTDAELGELRRKIDLAVQASLAHRAPAAEAPAPKADPVGDEIEYFSDPKAAIERAVSNHPLMKGLRSAAERTLARKTAESQQAASKTIRDEFPEASATLVNPEFRKFVEASPVRMELLRRAHTGYDVDAAREVFGAFKARNAATPKQSAKPTKPAMSGKIYRRSDVQRLMVERPDEYAKRADEIAAAYAQGRVK